jgi:hypothetical protein
VLGEVLVRGGGLVLVPVVVVVVVRRPCRQDLRAPFAVSITTQLLSTCAPSAKRLATEEGNALLMEMEGWK